MYIYIIQEIIIMSLDILKIIKLTMYQLVKINLIHVKCHIYIYISNITYKYTNINQQIIDD